MKPKVALAFILKADKTEIDYFEKCMASVGEHVDGVFINLNHKTKVSPKHSTRVAKILNKYKLADRQIYITKWKGNFVGERNYIFQQVPKSYTHTMWLDADDIVEHPEKIREVCALMEKHTNGLYVKYDYGHDEYGNVTVTHWVARIVRNNDSFAWKASFADEDVTVHETLNPKRKDKSAGNEEFWITHTSDEVRQDASLARNIGLLEKMLAKYPEGQMPDARILFYLATHYMDANRLLEAKALFEDYIKVSGWAEERSQAWVFLGMIYDAMGDLEKARGCYMRGLAENPNDPNPYVELGDLEIRDQLFDKAIIWLEMAVEKKLERQSIVRRPMDNTYRAYKLLSQAYVNSGSRNHKKASKWLEKALKLRPFDPELQQAREILDEVIEIRELTESTGKILKKLKTDEETKKVVPFLDNLPTKMQDNPLVVSARSYYTEPKVWDKKSIAIICGWGPLGNWGPKDLDKGIGGSEEAVIRISRELMNLGYDVTIFGTPGEEWGTHWARQTGGSVRWLHYWEFNRKDTFDIVINWRNPEFFDEPLNARKKYLWLHDVMDKEELIPERLANLDKLIFVSQYHRDLYPEIPDEKCFVSGNGITPEEFDIEKPIRDPHRIIYMSSHVRGLQMLYTIWPDVRKAVHDAKLDVYYGWSSYIAVNKNNPERMAWMEKMQNLEKTLVGVTDHGRIGHSQIVEEIYRSGVWAYPCPFPEVYCITAIKAQAGGAVPVSSNFAALDETVQFGTKVPMKAQDEHTPVGLWGDDELEQFKVALIDMLKHPEKQEAIRPEMMKWSRTQSWAKVAKEWDEDFSYGE